jgi:hypothetical protein
VDRLSGAQFHRSGGRPGFSDREPLSFFATIFAQCVARQAGRFGKCCPVEATAARPQASSSRPTLSEGKHAPIVQKTRAGAPLLRLAPALRSLAGTLLVLSGMAASTFAMAERTSIGSQPAEESSFVQQNPKVAVQFAFLERGRVCCFDANKQFDEGVAQAGPLADAGLAWRSMRWPRGFWAWHSPQFQQLALTLTLTLSLLRAHCNAPKLNPSRQGLVN